MAKATNNVNANAQATAGDAVKKPLFTVEFLESFYSGIKADEAASQALLVEKTKERLPTLYAAFKETSEVDFHLTVKQWKEIHKGDRSAAVRISESTALFFAARRVNAEFPDAGYHQAIKNARDALKKAGYRSNGDKELSADQKKFNEIKNAKAKARRELEKELGPKFFSMDEEDLAKLVKNRVSAILNPNTVPMEEDAKAEIIEHGKIHAMQHIEALALALGVEIKHEDGRLEIVIDEAAIIEEEEGTTEEKVEEKKAA